MKINGAIDMVQKRDGRIVPFEEEKITFATFKALRAVGKPNRELAELVSENVIKQLNGETPTVEEIQDFVELELFNQGEFKAAKAFIIYRRQHAGIRNIKELFQISTLLMII